jgi:hypothetical protein
LTDRVSRYDRPAEDNRVDIEIDRRNTRDQAYESQLDITEREYRRRIDPTYEVEYRRQGPREDIEVSKEEVRATDRAPRNDMGYYDDDGNYHSFRRGVERAADRVFRPFHHHHHHHDHHDGKEEVIVRTDETGPTRISDGVRENVRFVEPRGGFPANTVTIPCHFIRVGDLVILQGRPCQVIRISTSVQTGQLRYLGVDLFTRQLHEESSFVSNPGNSVIVQSMLGPVFKQYRILDMRDDGRLVCMTESGDVKQGLSVVDQGGLYGRIDRAFADGRGSVRALVVNDGGRELVVDYKVIHGSRL